MIIGSMSLHLLNCKSGKFKNSVENRRHAWKKKVETIHLSIKTFACKPSLIFRV